MREKSPSTCFSSASLFARTAASGAITITASKNASTGLRSVALACSASAYFFCCRRPSTFAASAVASFASVCSAALRQQLRIHGRSNRLILLRRLRQNVLHPLERRRDRRKIIRPANRRHRLGPRYRIANVIRAASEHGLDYVVGLRLHLAQIELHALERGIRRQSQRPSCPVMSLQLQPAQFLAM